ncbi:MAG: tripartite tricarboxylate transporter substrate binding protein [Burkholderiales bacterium]|nr:tripartite tricarboxylate transporter substrate binding protein [Burkholderiales bacterium]
MLKSLAKPIVACALLLALPLQALSQAAYPNRPVKILVGFPPGQATDVVAREIAQKLSEAMGQQFVVDNRAGAGGIIGTDLVAKAPADGYTLLMSSSGPLAVNPSLYRKLPYNVEKDFAPITLAALVPLFVVANPSFPPNTVGELVAYAKANPGKISYASGGNGVTNHLAMEMFKSVAGVYMTHIPYRGGPPAVTDLIAGQVSVMFETGPGALPHVRSGKLKALAVGSAARSSAAPSLPTVAESGLPGFDAVAWIGLVAPRGTPPAIITRLNAEVTRILKLPEIKDRFQALGAEPAGNTPEQFAAYIQSETIKWGKAVKDSGAKVD